MGLVVIGNYTNYQLRVIGNFAILLSHFMTMSNEPEYFFSLDTD